jgi:hypothetical protein
MNAAWTRGGEANPQSPGELGIAAGHQGRRLLMTHLHEADAVLALSQRLHDAVNAIAWQPEDGIDTPLEQAFHHAISGSSSHGSFLDPSETVSLRSSALPEAAAILY